MRHPALVIALLFHCGCGGATAADGDPDAAGTDADTETDSESETASNGWPEPNAWSWDGSWEPGPEDFPIPGLLDDEYFDGHPDGEGQPTPVLPPGAWDWDDGDDDLANWRNFETNVGSFSRLLDAQERHFGWRLEPVEPEAGDFSGAAAYFGGSTGTDVIDLGAGGAVHSFAGGNLSEGPDELVFRESWSLDFRTGSDDTGSERDNDLVLAGCGGNPDGSFDVVTTTIHTGPGRDWIFARDVSRSAIDAGNGAGGRTDTLDPADGDDLVVLRGNTHDFRVMGGGGGDTVVWHVDENVQTETWLGPNLFGGGGLGEALWDDPGTDRLVLAVPAATVIVTEPPTPEGALLVRATDGGYLPDEPTAADPFAAYCVECGTGPDGRKTVILEYVSEDGAVRTGYFFVTAFEELQVGIGEGARLFAIDDAAGTLSPLDPSALFVPPAWPAWRCP